MPSLIQGEHKIKGVTSAFLQTSKEQVLDHAESQEGYFTENRGQVADGIRFYLKGKPAVAFRDDGVMFVAREVSSKKPTYDVSIGGIAESAVERRHAYLLRFEGANAVEPLGIGRLPFNSNFFIGKDSSTWRSDVPNYKEIIYRDLYDDIDLVYRVTQDGLKYDYVVSPGADPNVIEMSYEGIDALTWAGGYTVINTSVGEIRDSPPTCYQEDHVVSCALEVRSASSFGFSFEVYDRSRLLIIDPLVYSTFLGGSGSDGAWLPGPAVAVDDDGSAYVAGITDSQDFPTTPGAYDVNIGTSIDGFVVKMDPMGSTLVFSTFIGGQGSGGIDAIALDTAKNVYVTGTTTLANFSTTPGAYDTSYNGNADVFVTKLSSMGNSLIYSTFVGGSSYERGNSIAVDSSGCSYVTGDTVSDDFPTTPGSYDRVWDGQIGIFAYWDSFVFKLNPGGNALQYSTFLGGTNNDYGNGITLDAGNDAFVTGATSSADFPTTVGAFSRTFGGGEFDTYVTKLNPSGSNLIYSTFIGGESRDVGNSIDVDSSDNAWLTGYTWSTLFPVTPGAFDTQGNLSDAFVVKVDSSGNSLRYSTYLGGSGIGLYEDDGLSIVVDGSDGALVSGTTSSFDFPVTPDAFQATYQGGGSDAFVTRFNESGSLTFSTFVGGSGLNWDSGSSIAADRFGSFYLTGYTDSADFPTTLGAYDRTLSTADVFVFRFAFALTNPPPVASGLGVQGYSSPPEILHITDSQPLLNWTYDDEDDEPQDWYEVKVGTSRGASNLWSLVLQPGTETSVRYDGLPLSRGEYYWFSVRVNDQLNNTTSWSYWANAMFHMNSIPTPPQTPVSPSEFSVVPATKSQNVSWGNSTDPEGDLVTYEWEVARDVGFTDLASSGTTKENKSSDFATGPGTAYYWRVRSRDDYEPTSWSAFGNAPAGMWAFLTENDDLPTIEVYAPPRLKQGDTYTLTWSMDDTETPDSQLIVYLNYSYGGVTYGIAGPLLGNSTYSWTVPSIERTDVRIEAIVIDSMEQKARSLTTEFEIFKESPELPPVDAWAAAMPVIAVLAVAVIGVFAMVVILTVLLLRERRMRKTMEIQGTSPQGESPSRKDER